MAEASTVPGSATCCRFMVETFAAVIPVAASKALVRASSKPKRVQSWPFETTGGGLVVPVPVSAGVVCGDWQATRVKQSSLGKRGMSRSRESGVSVHKSLNRNGRRVAPHGAPAEDVNLWTGLMRKSAGGAGA